MNSFNSQPNHIPLSPTDIAHQKTTLKRTLFLAFILSAIVMFGIAWYADILTFEQLEDKIESDISTLVATVDGCTPFSERVAEYESFNDGVFTHYVAQKYNDRILGLSDTCSLAEDEALLFAFDSIDNHGIWMKDMNYPIDIVWLDKNGNTVHALSEVSPETFPTAFAAPNNDACFVVELAAGAIERHQLGVNAFVAPKLIAYSQCQSEKTYDFNPGN